MQLKFGADPEVFYQQGEQFISAHGLVSGTKNKPLPVKNGAVQVDGMALEFNINPAITEDEWLFNIQSVMAQLQEMVPEGTLAAVPIAEFGLPYIKSQPPEARELGCDPDYNAWTGAENAKPDEDLPYRTGAGHIHIGFCEDIPINDEDHIQVCCNITKMLDFYLGLPSLLADNCTKRREMYGAAGAFRPKTYGVEYRVLSNFWLQSESLTRWAYRAAEKAVRAYVNGDVIYERWPDIQETINNSDLVVAKQIIAQEGLEVPCV